MAFCWYYPSGVWRGVDELVVVGRPNRGKRRNVKAARRAARRNR